MKTRGTSSAAEPLALPGAVKHEVKVDGGKVLEMMDLLFIERLRERERER